MNQNALLFAANTAIFDRQHKYRNFHLDQKMLEDLIELLIARLDNLSGDCDLEDDDPGGGNVEDEGEEDDSGGGNVDDEGEDEEFGLDRYSYHPIDQSRIYSASSK